MDPQRSRSQLLHRLLAWCGGWLVAGSFYLVLIDTPDLPELLVAAGAATLAATGFELAREQGVIELRLRPGWFARVHRPVARVPVDIALVSLAALRQLVRPRSDRGRFRAVRFRGAGEQHGTGKQALAEGLGSFAPNTIVVGVDPERKMLLVHQLERSGGREALDPLELG